ncbi:MAG TPA: YfhO family protein, partial [Chloroflexia bacterium]|nr:YfhO family protein [Chloroflexia bacterium]
MAPDDPALAPAVRAAQADSRIPVLHSVAEVSRRELGWALVGCAIVATLFLAPAIFTGRILSPAALLYQYAPWFEAAPPGGIPTNGLLSDSVLQFEPWLTFAAQRLHGGALPLWNPNNLLGAPFIGNMQSAVFSPLNWPYYLWPDAHLLVLRAWLKLLIVALGMYLLARQVGRVGPIAASVAALTFALGAFMTAWLLYPHTGVIIWLPWLWLATARLLEHRGRSSVAALALVVALQLVAGHPELAYFSALATGAFAIFWSWQQAGSLRRMLYPLILAAGGYILGALLAAVQLVPFLEYLANSATLLTRSNAGPLDAVFAFHYAWTLVAPELYGNPAHGTWWEQFANYNEVNIYSGIMPLLLAPFALLAHERRMRWLVLFLLALSVLVISLVYGVPGIHALLIRIPLLQVGATSRAIAIAQFTLALLAGIGAQSVQAHLAAGRGRLLAVLAGTVAALLAVGVGVPLLLAHTLFTLPTNSRSANQAWSTGLQRPLLFIGAGALALVLVITLYRRRRNWSTRLLAVLPGLLAVDLWQVHGDYNPTMAAADYYPPTAITRFLQEQPAPARVVNTGWALMPNTNLAYGYANLTGYDAITPRTYQDLITRLDPGIRAGGGYSVPSVVQSRLINLLNVRYVFAVPDDNPNYLVTVRQESNGRKMVGEIRGERRPGQTFVSRRDNVAQIQVLGSTLGRANRGRLVFHLKTDPAAPTDLVTQEVVSFNLANNAYWTFSFPPVTGAMGRSFYFYFDSPAAPPGQAVTLWYTE